MSLSLLIDRLVREQGLPVLDRDGVGAFARQQEYCVLCFFNDPKANPENFDVAVILPEILKAFPAIRGAIIDPQAAAQLIGEYGVGAFPALVFLCKGQVRSLLARVHSWSEYHAHSRQLFDAPDKSC